MLYHSSSVCVRVVPLKIIVFLMTIKFKLLTRFLKYSLGFVFTHRTLAEKKPPLSYPTGHPNNIQFIMTYSIKMSAAELTKKTEMMGSSRSTVDRFEIR